MYIQYALLRIMKILSTTPFLCVLQRVAACCSVLQCVVVEACTSMRLVTDIDTSTF